MRLIKILRMSVLSLALLITAGRAVKPAHAQTPARATKAAPQRGAATTPARGAAATAYRADANLRQLMKGILFPNSNVIFAAQSENPAEVKPAADPSLATNPLASTYGGWDAVESSSLALVEA